MLTTLRTLSITLATVSLFVLVLCCDVEAQSVTSEALEQHVRAAFSAWAAGDPVKGSVLESGAVGFGFRTQAARSAIPKSAYIERLRSFLASFECDRPTLNDLHTAVDGDIGLAWGFYTEDFKVRGREPEKVRARFTLTLKHDTSGWRALLYHRDIQPFDEKGKYISIAPSGATSSAPAQTPEKNASDRAEQEVKDAESRWTEARLRNDAAPLNELMSDDWIRIHADGRLGLKKDLLTAVALGDLKYERISSDEQQFRAYKQAAVVTVREKSTAKLRNAPLNTDQRFTHVWEKRQGRWRMIVSYSSRIAQEQTAHADQGAPTLPTPQSGSSKSEKDTRSKSADKAGNAEQEVRQVERELTEALSQGDFETVERIYAEDYALTTADGELQNKSRRIAALKSTDPKSVNRNRDGIAVRVYGDTAVVTGRTLFKVRSKGEESSESRRFIHVWEKRQGRWQMVASQVTRVAEAPILPKANGGSFASAAKSEPATGASETSIEQEIKRLEDERAEAVERGDTELLKRMSSDDYIVTSATGQVKSKAQVLEGIKSGQNRWKSIHDDVRVRVYGDTAVITGRSTRKGRANNNELDDQVRFTGVYVKQNGRWLKVAQQATRIAGLQVPLAPAQSGSMTATEDTNRTQDGNAEQAIRQVLEEYREAILKNDVLAMDRIETADFTLTVPSGLYRNKSQQLAQAPGNQFEFIIWDDITVRIYGDTAVVTFNVRRKSKLTGEEQLRVLAVYVKQNGQWKVVAQQATRIGH